jgi:uncharacterized protein YndB with AHSA1/START domain
METQKITTITVETTVHAPVEKVWKLWNGPEHITQWNTATPEWHTPTASNDLRIGGKLQARMEAKDGSMGFDFEGVYNQITPHQFISYTIADGRKVSITFSTKENSTHVVETFEAENTHPIEMQRGGWQAILDNFKKYVESSTALERIHFEIEINASPERVYKTMLDDQHYKTWTAAFNPTSSFKGSWSKGSKILFIGTDEQGNMGGMVSRIKENIPNQFVSIEHLGILQGEKEILEGKDVDGWAGSHENYTYSKQGDKTLLAVDLDSNHEFKSYFTETYPKALAILKALCEK